jgi:hypothetical protein
VGARKGGLFGYHRWPLKVRLGLFAAFFATFWGGTAWGCWRWPEERDDVLGLAVVMVVIGLLFYSLRASVQRSREAAHGKKRAKIAQSLLSPEKPKKPWWSFLRRKPVTHE